MLDTKTTPTHDLFVRLCHWFIALLFVAAFFIVDGGDLSHELVGYAIAALVLFRLLWGLLGPPSARLSLLVFKLKDLRSQLSRLYTKPLAPRLAHTRPAQANQAHDTSALASLMKLNLWLLLLLCALSGWAQETERFWGEAWLQKSHELLAETLFAFIAVHITAVLFIQFKHQPTLIASMLFF